MTTEPNQPGSAEAPRHYAWPKYVLLALAMFFTVCLVWTVKEVNRLKRAKANSVQTDRSSSVAPGTSSATSPPSILTNTNR